MITRGEGHLREKFEALSYPSLGYQIKNDPIKENALTAEGFLTMVMLCLLSCFAMGCAPEIWA